MDHQSSNPVDKQVSPHNAAPKPKPMSNILQTPDHKNSHHDYLSTQLPTVSQASSAESSITASHSHNNSGGQASEVRFGNWDKKFLLTLDGGGVRGFSTLLIIQELMKLCKNIEQRENPDVDSSYYPIRFQKTQASGLSRIPPSQFLPVHYFDYIAGTSTGGLIAIMLSRLRMTIDECIEEYSKMGKHVFGSPRTFSMRGPIFIPWKRPKYDYQRLEEAIKLVVERRHPREDQVYDAAYPSAPDRCRTIVVAVRENNYSSQPYLFRTYEHTASPNSNILELNPGLPAPVPIWQVARATTAAPTYFKPLIIGKEKFVDGGWGSANNPTWHAYQEVCQMEGNKSDAIELTVSIGTGKADKVRPVARRGTGIVAEYKTLLKYSAAATTDSEEKHRVMKGLPTTTEDNYQRFNVDGGLGDVNLGEWKVRGERNLTLEKIAGQTRAYLDQEDTKRRLRKVARTLVKNRQERSKDPKWAIVATGHRYRCSVDGCLENIFTREEDLRIHLQNLHLWPTRTHEDRTKLERAVHRGRILYAD